MTRAGADLRPSFSHSLITVLLVVWLGWMRYRFAVISSMNLSSILHLPAASRAVLVLSLAAASAVQAQVPSRLNISPVGSPEPSQATTGTNIVDNPAATLTGTWTPATSSVDKYLTNYAFASSVSGTATVTATWRPKITTPGNLRCFRLVSARQQPRLHPSVPNQHLCGHVATRDHESARFHAGRPGIFTLSTTNELQNYFRLKVQMSTHGDFSGWLAVPAGKSFSPFASEAFCGPNRAYIK